VVEREEDDAKEKKEFPLQSPVFAVLSLHFTPCVDTSEVVVCRTVWIVVLCASERACDNQSVLRRAAHRARWTE